MGGLKRRGTSPAYIEVDSSPVKLRRALPPFSSRFFSLWILTAFLAFGSLNSVRAASNAQEQAVANLLVNAFGQQRQGMKADATLSKVARERAADMANRGYVGHVNPNGEAANWLVEKAGYQLPDSYPSSKSANSIESFAAGRDSAQKVWDDWKNSSSHRTHLLGTNSMFEEQTSYGIGYYFNPGSTYQHYWVIITAPPGDNVLLTFSVPSAGASVSLPQVAVSGVSIGGAVTAVQIRLENAVRMTPYRVAQGVGQWVLLVDGSRLLSLEAER